MKKSILSCLCFTICSLYGNTQDIPVMVEQGLEELSGVEDKIQDDDLLLEQLAYFRKRPLAINRAGKEDLEQIPWLTAIQIQNFLFYRKALGNLVSFYELQSVPGWDLTTIRKTLPYITIEGDVMISEENIISRLKDGDHQILLRASRILEPQKGFNKSVSSHYAGSKDKLLFNYKYVYKNLLQYGVTGEKDPGEAFLRGAQSGGFDFYSFHLCLRKIGLLKSLILGDYNINLGQGLIQWQSVAFYKGSDAMGIKRQSPVLMPYQSAGETNFYRGIGFSIQRKLATATGFISKKNRSGNVVSDTITGQSVFTSFNTSGLHRTPEEIKDKNGVGYFTAGGNLTVTGNFYKIGFNVLHHAFTIPLQPPEHPFKIFAVSGQRWSNYSMNQEYTYRNMHLYAEAAVDKRGGKAFLAGTLISLHPKADLAMLYRNIDKSYQAISAHAFTENSSPSNELGWYTGLTIRPVRSLKMDLYVDTYRFPWIKYRVNKPSTGKDGSFQLLYLPDKQMEVRARFKWKQKETNHIENDSVIKFANAKLQKGMRLHIVYKLSEKLSVKGNTEVVWLSSKTEEQEQGFLTYLQCNYLFSKPLSSNMRLQFFNTDGYDSRIYAYENDVSSSYSIPASFGNGFKYFINCKYEIDKHINFSLRWNQTVFYDRELFGSSGEEIVGNMKSEVKIQVMINL